MSRGLGAHGHASQRRPAAVTISVGEAPVEDQVPAGGCRVVTSIAVVSAISTMAVAQAITL